MLCVALALNHTKVIPMMSVPTFNIGNKVIEELKQIEPNEVYTIIDSVPSNLNIPQYNEYEWKFIE